MQLDFFQCFVFWTSGTTGSEHIGNVTWVEIRNAKFRPGSSAGPKIQDRPSFLRSSNWGRRWSCRAHGRWSRYLMHWLPGFVRCLKDAGRARCWSQHILCSADLGSGLAFGEIPPSLEGILLLPSDISWPIINILEYISRRIATDV